MNRVACIPVSTKMIFLSVLFIILGHAAAGSWSLGGFGQIPAIFQFGDSLSDTGNSLIAFPQVYKRLGTLPYGETFFHHPAGRECDGRLLIDFLASGFGLPLLDPYLLRSQGKDWRHGVNFAVCGATALGLKFYRERNMFFNSHTLPIDVQLQWFHDFRNTSALRFVQGRTTHPAPVDFSRALYIVGEIGGNDYTFMKKSGMEYSQMLQLVPLVVQAIRNLIQDLYSLGARNFLVINIPRQGCNPFFLASRRPSDRLDELGCIADFNAVDSYHNSLLRAVVDDLRTSLSGASIAHFDYYGLITSVLQNPEKHGFTEPRTLCCGSPWRNGILDCVDGGVVNGVHTTGQTCANPSTHIYWNGNHFTEHFYNVAASAFLSGQFVDLVTHAKI